VGEASPRISIYVALLAFLIGQSSDSVFAQTVITVKAHDFAFEPETVTMRAGVATTVHFVSSDGVHGIVSKELNIPKTLISPDEPVDVVVTPARSGRYVVHCANVCGIGHSGMALTIVVDP
jgi:cytochrome c oxidase subunit 2